MGFVRLVGFGFIALTVIYLSISIYSRSVRKERLENEFDEKFPDGGETGARDTFIAEGMRAYNSSIRPKLIGLVYVIPTAVIATIVYITNAN